MKTCFKCKTHKELSEFYKHPEMKDGHLNKCKECTKVDSSMRDPQKVRIYEKERSQTQKRKDLQSRVQKEYRINHPKRNAALSKTRRAILSGKIIKSNCQFCGDPKVIAHHEDYEKPLEIMWLCQKCHKLHHAHK